MCARALPLLIARDVNPPDARILSSLSGYMPQLESLFGAGAFDERNADTRFRVFAGGRAVVGAAARGARLALFTEARGLCKARRGGSVWSSSGD